MLTTHYSTTNLPVCSWFAFICLKLSSYCRNSSEVFQNQVYSDARFCQCLVIDWLKSPKINGSNPIRTLVQLKYSCGGLMSCCFYDAMNKPAIVLSPNSSLVSVQNTDMLTSASGLQGHCVSAEVSGFHV